MELVDPAQLKLEGEYQERIERAIHHMLDLDTDEMRREFTNPNQQWHWGADYMGRWVGAMALLSHFMDADYGVGKVVRELMNFQEADGSFGPFTHPHDEQEWFGMGRGLVGILEYYSIFPESEALESATRLGDYYIAQYPEDEEICDLCECYSSALEGIVLLARVTGQTRYLDFARTMAERSTVMQRRYFSTTLGEKGWRAPMVGHTHCQLLTARGMIDLYEQTGEARWLQPVLDLHRYFLNELMWISGGIGEFVHTPEVNETCSDADWLRLNLQLWKVTGEQEYLELGERILFNQLFFDQDGQGAFCFWRSLQGGMGSTFDACCSHHGTRALWDGMRYLYTLESGVIQANMFMDGSANLPVNGETIQIASRTSYDPDTFVITFDFANPPTIPFTFRVRVPEWASAGQLFVNRQKQAASETPGYLEVQRTWSNGDQVEVHLTLEPQIVTGHRIGSHVLNTQEVAVFFGPRLFCLTDRQNINLVPPIVRLDLSQAIRAKSMTKLEATGHSMIDEQVNVILTPLADIGGRSHGKGRVHSVRTDHFKVWIPFQAADESVRQLTHD